MGTWSEAINGSDQFMEIYETFPGYFFSYVEGAWFYDTDALKNKLAEVHGYQLDDDRFSHDFWFALAKRFWEFNVNDPQTFERVKHLIESGANLALWKELDATEESLVKRKKVLEKFLATISQPNPKPKERKQVLNRVPLCKEGELITFQYKGNYYAAVTSGGETNKHGLFILHLLNYRSPQKPDQETLLNCEYMSIDFRPQVTYAPEEFNLANRNNVKGLLFRNKCFDKATIKLEKVGVVTFLHHGFFRDGMESYHSVETDPGDNLAKYAVMNYLPEGFGGQMLLKYATEQMQLSPAQIAGSLEAIEAGREFTLFGMTIRPDILFANVSFNSVYIKGLEQYNKYHLGSLLSQIYCTVRSAGKDRFTGMFLKDYQEAIEPEYGSQVVSLAEYFQLQEQKAKAAIRIN